MTDGLTRRGFVAAAGAALAAGWRDWSDVRVALADTGLADEDGSNLWLRYPLVDDAAKRSAYQRVLAYVVAPPAGNAVMQSAATELTTALKTMLGRDTPLKPTLNGNGAIVVGTPDSSSLVAQYADRAKLGDLGEEGYTIQRKKINGFDTILVASNGDRGALYGAFHLLRLVQTQASLDKPNVSESPVNQLRLTNHWDNLDRSVERGYAGDSVFFWNELPQLRPSYETYARALASVGINGTVINNVNANAQFISPEMLAKLAPLAGVLRKWGISMYVSVNFASPILLGGLATADPFDAGVKQWWKDKANEIYATIPDLGGFLVKADSEGQPGPISYGRTHADGANMLAAAVQPHDGIVMWRAFVHDFDALEWSNKSYETFTPLDGKFAANTVVQIKNGPIDFQVREPTHPLFGALPNTNSMMELQITQEYTGQSTHLCYLVPMWKEVYDFDTYAEGKGTTVADIVSGQTYGYGLSGVAGVMNFGDDKDWTRNQLNAANTHGYARLAWNPSLPARAIANEWTRQTFGNSSRVVNLVNRLLLDSWQTYIDYTNPLGISFQITADHFTPSPQTNTIWHQADANGTGFDRTVATGTGYTAFYHSPVKERYESVADTPDELLLFLHHVPYSHKLKSGKTVLQHIYDSHFDGRTGVAQMRQLWQSLRGHIDEKRWADTLERFDRQLDQATLWRDTIVGYYFSACRILDTKRSWVQVTPTASSAVHLQGGWPNLLEIEVANASANAAELVAGLPALDGWSSGTETISLPARGLGKVRIPVNPALRPETAVLRPTLKAGKLQALITEAPVITAPAGRRCRLALDAGSPTSPLLDGYRRLSPSDAWDSARGFGWVDGAPQSRDRNQPDPLLRDFVNDTVARTLRLTIPAGEHSLYLLTGETSSDSFPTTVRMDGAVVGTSVFLPGGNFEWLDVPVDGGASGKTIDLEFSNVPGQHWHLVAIAIPDEALAAPPAIISELTAPSLVFAGQSQAIPVRLAATDAAVDATVRAVVPAGWTTAPVTVRVTPGALADVELTFVPDATPAMGSVRVEVVVDGAVTDTRELELVAVPAGASLALALDAGTTASPLVAGYQRLSNQAWDPALGFGWVGTAAMNRDRALLDDLRRDFVNDNAPRTLRIAVPAGAHEAYVLVGDANQPSAPTFVKSGGQLLAQSPSLGNGAFAWVRVPLAGGQTYDLELSGDGTQHWHLNALLLRAT